MGFEKHAFSIRLPEHLRTELDALAEAMDRSRAYIVKEAIEAYVSERRHYIEELKSARESALRRPSHSAEQIFAWMDSWGTDKELPPPEPDIPPDRNP